MACGRGTLVDLISLVAGRRYLEPGEGGRMTIRPPTSPREGERGAQRRAAFKAPRRTPLTPEYYPLQMTDVQAPESLEARTQLAAKPSLPAARYCRTAARRLDDGNRTPTRAKG